MLNNLDLLLRQLTNAHILIREEIQPLLPAHLLQVHLNQWEQIAAEMAHSECRWVGMWAEEQELVFLVNVCYEKQGMYLVLRVEVPHSVPVLPSHAPYYPAANRAERHIQDLFGLVFSKHPDVRRWTRHQAWQAGEHPLRKHFSAQGTPITPSPPDSTYPFVHAQGSGVYEIPVGPIHAGIIEPGHFRFQAVGETVLNLEEHLGYVHKGIEKIAEGREATGLARLAARVSGDTTVAHSWAACMAMERAANLTLPPRALTLRAILCERERIANHLGDIGAICNDVAFAFAFYQFSRLREIWQRLNQHSFGHRLLMDCIIPGGVRVDLPPEHIDLHQQQINVIQAELRELEGILRRHSGLEDRVATTGILTPTQARQFGCLGYVGRASGHSYDVRRDAPYPPYDQFSIKVPEFTEGDVKARIKVRVVEIYESLRLLWEMLERLPGGAIHTSWVTPSDQAEGLGIVEGWRGEIMAYVRFGKEGKIIRYYPRDPSCLNWPVLELLIRNNIVPDFPVCNKSVNGSYSGHDL